MTMTQRPVFNHQIGDVVALDYKPGAAVAAGQVVLHGIHLTISTQSIPANVLGATFTGGVWKVPKDGSAFSDGDAVYWAPAGNPVNWTAGTGAATATPGTNLFGRAVGDALAGDEFLYVKNGRAENLASVGGSMTADDITGSDSSLAIAGKAGVGAGTAGAVTVKGGDSAGATGTAGRLTLDAGAATGGTADYVDLAPTNASKVKIGKPIDLKIGASTAAAGSTNADATGLPAGTGTVYPTTAADDTKGVIIDAADKVDGRTLLIGNGVGNKILKVYPPSGGSINGLGANAAFSSASGKGVIITCLSASGNTWLAW